MADVDGTHEDENIACENVNNKETGGRDHFFNGLETLVVDNILDARETKNCRQYLVSFKSWIAEDYLQDYHDLLQHFWSQRTEKENGEATLDVENEDEEKEANRSENESNKEDDRNQQEDEFLNEYENEQRSRSPEPRAEDFDETSEELLPPFHLNGVENETAHYDKDKTIDEDKENDDLNDVTNSTSSDSLETNILRESNPSKKRKLKTLDDIVRKITKSNDGKETAQPNGNNEDVKLTDRLYTLDQTLNEDIENRICDKNEEPAEIFEKEATRNGSENNIYWSGGKAYQKNGEQNGEKRCNDEEKSPTSDKSIQQVKSRQRYQKCRFCSTLYSDPALLERHENSHFIYNNRHGIPFHEGIPPPPLVPVVENHRREFPQYQGEGRLSPPKTYFKKPLEDSSIVRKPIRNLLSKMYESNSHEKCEQPWPSPDNQKRSPSPQQKQDSPKSTYEEKIVTCPLCKAIFEKMESFEKHFEASHPEVTKFTCNVCDEIFLNQEHFEVHTQSHTELEYVCQFCQKSFNQKTDYEAHIATHHTQERPFRCHVCGRSFSLRTNLRRHLLVHADVTPYFCHVCGKGFRRSDILNVHMKEHHLNTNGSSNGHSEPVLGHRIEGVPHIYPPVYGLRHSEGHHGGSQHTSPRQMEHSPSRSSNTSHDSNEHQHYEPVKLLPPTRYYKERPYPYDGSFSPNHSQSKYKVTPKSPHLLYRDNTDPNMFYHQIRSHSNEIYDTNHRMKLMQKRRSFSPIKPNPMKIAPSPVQPPRHQVSGGAFECLKCGEKFSSPSLYDIHVQSHKEVFECEKCHKSFAVRSQFDVHMQSHDNSKSHKCPYCHRSFSMKGNLRRHIRIHTNEAPYECPICFQRFRRSDGLKGHIKRHETLGESAPTDLLPSQASQ